VPYALESLQLCKASSSFFFLKQMWEDLEKWLIRPYCQYVGSEKTGFLVIADFHINTKSPKWCQLAIKIPENWTTGFYEPTPAHTEFELR
jgi:hypothetical protein